MAVLGMATLGAVVGALGAGASPRLVGLAPLEIRPNGSLRNVSCPNTDVGAFAPGAVYPGTGADVTAMPVTGDPTPGATDKTPTRNEAPQAIKAGMLIFNSNSPTNSKDVIGAFARNPVKVRVNSK
jgi:hypothetical protein